MLLTLNEAAGRVERCRGKRVWKKTIKAWGEGGKFKLHWVNGWKVDEVEFLKWAARAGRLKQVSEMTEATTRAGKAGHGP